ncbi:CU044_5270 family protein [Streptomyces sp. XM4193]|nr:CU044_5270 family protein [Streptomyces sp. XM4193]MCK1794476.1 CU044_5270 family protein [Streptomyces sp. XM4193]
MNTHRSPHPTEWEETRGLVPPVDRELPAGRHEFHKERLMARIHDESRTTSTNPAASDTPAAGPRSWFRRPVIAVPLAACALTGLIATGAVLVGQDGDDEELPTAATGPVLTTEVGAASTSGTDELLDRISTAAKQSAGPDPRPDQWIYVESTVANTYVRTVENKHTVVSEKPHTRQVWQSPDGHKGWLIEPGNSPEGGETLDSEHSHTGAWDKLKKLPTEPDALLKKIYAESKDQGNSRDHAAFDLIGDLISESYAPAGLEAALYKAAAKIPGVVNVDDAVDAVGRKGVAVARLDEFSGERTEWIFDRRTHAFLGERGVQVKEPKSPNEEDLLMKPGTVTFTSATTARAVVDELKQKPSAKS